MAWVIIVTFDGLGVFNFVLCALVSRFTPGVSPGGATADTSAKLFETFDLKLFSDLITGSNRKILSRHPIMDSYCQKQKCC